MTDDHVHTAVGAAPQAHNSGAPSISVDSLADEAPHIGLQIPIKTIQRAVCDFYGVTMDGLMSERRTAKLAFARHVAMYLSFELTKRGCTNIARMFDRDHTSILHAQKRIARMMAADPSLAAEVDLIRAELEAQG
jgi:chromosomal replication initiator protein